MTDGLWKGGNFFMLKKAIPFILVSGLVLGACGNGNNGAVPNNNETPMEDMNNREGNWTPNVQDEHRGGTDLDGLDTEQNGNNGGNGGVINDDNLNNDNDNMLRDENNGNQRNNGTNNR